MKPEITAIKVIIKIIMIMLKNFVSTKANTNPNAIVFNPMAKAKIITSL